MNINELKEKLDNQIYTNEILLKQTNIMKIALIKKFEKDDGTEKIVTYGINEVFNDFIYKENKVLFFIDKYLKTFRNYIENKQFELNDVSFPLYEHFNDTIYYFDSVISSFYVIIEAEQKDILCNYLNKNKILDFYPTRAKFGLWWQIYMLRNRIVHITGPRYSDDSNVCKRYIDFSSKALMVNIINKKINIKSTLIDIYKDENIKKVIDFCIKNKDYNPFDLLFPNKSAKGKGKKNPVVLYIENDIYFDYVSSGVNLIDDIQKLLNNINYEFINEFSKDYDNKEELLQTKTCYKNIENIYSIKDVFENLS